MSNQINENYKYLPRPPREWNRFENSCAYLTETVNGDKSFYFSLLKKFVTYGELIYLLEQYRKGNILQYKGNSSQLTKQQKYAQIAKGMWINRNTTWASQSETYTNPNTQSLKRINYDTIPLNPNSTENNGGTLCPIIPPTPQYPVLPSTDTSNGKKKPPIIPPPPVKNDSIVMPPIINPVIPEPTILIPVGGNLICSQVENICTGEIIKNFGGILQCSSTTESDVPGKPKQLCWNDGLDTYFPHERNTYASGGNKFPVNYKGLTSAIRPMTPILSIDETTVDSGFVTLNWIFNYSDCIPITSFLLYQNEILIQSINYTSRSTIVKNLPNCEFVSFYLVAYSNAAISNKSNIVSTVTYCP